MYKSLLLVVAAAAAFLYYKTHAPLENVVADAEPQPIAVSVMAPMPEPVFRCEGKQHCSQMASCAEARFYLKNCPAVKMDGDGDGIPCETPPLQCMFWCADKVVHSAAVHTCVMTFFTKLRGRKVHPTNDEVSGLLFGRRF